MVGVNDRITKNRRNYCLPRVGKLPLCAIRPDHSDQLPSTQSNVNQGSVNIRIAVIFPFQVGSIYGHVLAQMMLLEFQDLIPKFWAVFDYFIIAGLLIQFINPWDDKKV